MTDLSTRYMGLDLKNPIVVASCGLTTTLQGVQNCANSGAGAIVLKSLFEEQINVDVEALMVEAEGYQHTEAIEYLAGYGHAYGPREYLDLIHAAKKSVDVPIIASINCITAERWGDYAAQLAAAGAAALHGGGLRSSVRAGLLGWPPALGTPKRSANHIGVLR